MQRSTVVLPQPDGPNRAVTPFAGALKPASSVNLPSAPRKAARMVCVAAHPRILAKRFSIRVIDRITTKAKTTMPPARMLASRHCMVST